MKQNGERPVSIPWQKTYQNIISVPRYLRVWNGLTQREVSQRVGNGLTCNDISRLERGNFQTGIGKLMLLAQFYQTDVQPLIDNDFVAAAATQTKEPAVTHHLRGRIKKKQQVNDATGDRGEAWVLEWERQRLADTPYAAAINPNFGDDGDAHFDLLSFDADTGDQRIIEVKTTSGAESTPFFMSTEELRLMRLCMEQGIQYELHRVYFVDNAKKRGCRIYTPEAFLEAFSLTTSDYLVTRKEAV